MEIFKNTIWTHLENREMESLKKLLSDAEVIEILNVIRELSSEEQAIVYRLLSKDKALEIFEQLDTHLQQKLLASFTEERVIEIISELAPDDRVRLLDELPAKVTKKLVDSLSPEERKETALLMGYEEETAGRIMTTEYVRLKRSYTAGEALEKVRANAKEKETIYTIYITDDSRKLEGVLSLRELVMASPEDILENIMHQKVIKASTSTDQEEVARTLQELDLLALPVVDNENRLVGIITIDDAMDILEEETTEDIFDKAGLADFNRLESDRSARLVTGSVFQIWKVRLPFLLITMFGGLMAGVVIGAFEESLEAIAAVAIFIPVIMDMGGNAGTQSSTIFARGVILGHINTRKFLDHLRKETLVGLSMGALIGVATGIIASVWQGIPELGIAVGLALAITMTLATALGFLIPFMLLKLGVDQAAGADPIITTIKDISGLLIYFVLVNQFLGYLL
ncbi:magnesium transporter [Alkaliphilus metalliredigens QYMF]|uniref:Magnesium transporter MgtE n=1 Tax=Alkaliphilus metalliredigens (strain QYMF) TaxID=293826 RepID=A6TT66_ALKMQ|nr:magnesium transporter [Alkaliphilus metalliredigens]ABR49384.1 magnesium transporter [Alkaliphilus metalliredigens QYMF]